MTFHPTGTQARKPFQFLLESEKIRRAKEIGRIKEETHVSAVTKMVLWSCLFSLAAASGTGPARVRAVIVLRRSTESFMIARLKEFLLD